MIEVANFIIKLKCKKRTILSKKKTTSRLKDLSGLVGNPLITLPTIFSLVSEAGWESWLRFVISHSKPTPQVASTPRPASSSSSGPVGAVVSGVLLAPLPLLLWL